MPLFAPAPASAASAYGRLDRLLHRIALGSGAVLEMSFDLERARHGKAAAALALGPPVFVTGLARAGTTILMRLIHAADDFASLRYRDLPFPLAPNGWARISARLKRHVETRERGHGDGLDHDLDSPEAIEEVFWKLHDGKHYCRPDGLIPYQPDAETLSAFADYRQLVCLRYGARRYLSKNNANVLRVNSLARHVPGARIVHPFRDPLEQARSLHRQHRQACILASEDPFRSAFMRWLGHHEFGAHQQPFLLPAGSAPQGDPDTLAFWVSTWIGVHTHLLGQPEDVRRTQIFADYDLLAAGDPALLERLGSRLELARPLASTALRPPAPVPHREAKLPAGLLEEANRVHAALRERARAE